MQALSDQCQAPSQLHRGVVVCSGGEIHGFGQSSVMLERMSVFPHEFAHRIGREEFARHSIGRRLPRRGLGPVFAELGNVSFLWLRIRPGTARAVEAVDVVELQQG